MLGDKPGIDLFDIAAGLADDLDVSNDRVLHELVARESCLIEVFDVAKDSFDRLANVFEIVGYPQRLFHIGAASARTRARNLAGKALGVSTSTFTCSRSVNSLRIPPRSNNVIPTGSTRMSMSLSSSSSPPATEPKTRGLVARWAATMPRIASR